jgi:hypothetical protein
VVVGQRFMVAEEQNVELIRHSIVEEQLGDNRIFSLMLPAAIAFPIN